MILKIAVPFLTVVLTTQIVASSYIPFLYPGKYIERKFGNMKADTFCVAFFLENIAARTTIVSAHNEGNLVLKSFSGIESKRPQYDSPQVFKALTKKSLFPTRLLLHISIASYTFF